MPELSPAQRRAVNHPAERLQIVACAGSGKTEVLAQRVVRLLREDADPASIVAFTFTEKAARELAQRIERRAAEADPRFARVPPSAGGLSVGTTHSFALRSLRELGGRYELMDGLTEEREWALAHRVARRLGIVDLYAQARGREPETVAAAQAITPFLRSAAIVHDELIDRTLLAERAPEFADCLERYERLLSDMRLIPFRAMITEALHGLGDGGRLRRRLAETLTHVLVDEHQDFNRAQDELLRRLAASGANVTVVGDDDQAIYQWRGGDVSLFAGFPTLHPPSEGGSVERLALAENRRCRPEIVSFASSLVADLAGTVPKERLAAREPHGDGAVEVLPADTPEQEATLIAGRIAKLVRAGHVPGEVAVLYRSVRSSAAPLIDALGEQGIDVNVVGKTSLMLRDEMRLIAHVFVHWAGGSWHPHPSRADVEQVTRELLLSEIAEVGSISRAAAEDALGQLDQRGERIRKEGIFDSVPLLEEMLRILWLPGKGEHARRYETGLGRMSELLTDFDHGARRAAPAYLYAEAPGSAAATQEAVEDDALGPRPSANLLGRTSGEIYLMRMRAFLEEFAGRAAEETPDAGGASAEAVQVMTVHQAKGLEFQVVFVPCLVQGRFPSAMMGREGERYVPDELFESTRYEGRIEDEARLLYVALTRARELVVLSWFTHHSERRRAAALSQLVRDGLIDGLRAAHPCGAIVPEADGQAAPAENLLDLDFSTLHAYTVCGYQYWLRHVCGFQPPIAPELGFGKLLHHLIAELARRAADGVPPRPEHVQPLLEGSFYMPFAGPVPAARLREAAAERTLSYLRGHGDELVRTLRSEASFEVPIAGARLRGRIDLMLRAPGGAPEDVELIDFKTSVNRPPAQVHENQLRIYAAAAERVGYRPRRIAIHDLEREGRRIEISEDARARDRFASQLDGWVTGIRENVFTPASEAKICHDCDFKGFCPEAAAQ